MSASATIAGTLTRDPELRFTTAGKPVASFTVVTATRFLDKTTNEWQETDTSFWDCTAFGPIAENIADSLSKGMRVVCTGKIKQDSYTTKEGEKRTTWRFTADDVAISLKWKKQEAVASNGSSRSYREEPPF